MPRPKRPCLHAGCPRLTPGTYCPTHRTAVERARHNPEYDTPRWRRLRKKVIDKHRASFGYLCPGYETPPHLTDRMSADHIVPLDKGGAMYDEANVQALCVSCNSRKGRRGVG